MSGDLRDIRHDPIAAFREISQSAYPQARVLPRSHLDRFGYQIDARLLVKAWDDLATRAERAEARAAELEATLAALVQGLS